MDSRLSRANRELYGAAFKAYAFAIEHLDTETWRPMKVALVMFGCRVKRSTAIDAMRALVARGYLARRGGGPNPYEYRLLPPPMPAATQPVKARAA